MQKTSGFDQKAFCERLRSLREYHGFSQKEMADALCVERSTYSGYEIGRALPSLASIKIMSEMLQVSADELLGVEKPVPNFSLRRYR